jgi:hypothetical protein
MNKILFIIIILSVCIGCGDSSGFEEHGIMSDTMPGIGEAGPLHQSQSCIIESNASQGEAEITIPVDTPEEASFVLLGEENAVVKTSSQINLSGTLFNEPELKKFNLPSTGTSYSLSHFSKGSQIVKFKKLSKGKARIFVSQPKSPLNLELQVKPLSVRSGEKVTIEARLRDQQPVYQAVVVAEYGINNSAALKDDGIAPDAVKEDGVYTVQITAPDVAAFKKTTIRVRASGSRFNRFSFLRNSSAAILVTRAGTKIDAAAATTNNEHITIPVKASSPFNARIDIMYGRENTAIAWSRKDMVFLNNDSVVSLSRPTETLAADKAVIRVLNHDTKGLEDEVVIALTPEAALFVKKNEKKSAAAEMPSVKKQSAQQFGE